MNHWFNPRLQITRRATPKSLRALFKVRNCIAIYATQNPTKRWRWAAPRGLNEGRLLQMGQRPRFTINQKEYYYCEMFSEPPIKRVQRPSPVKKKVTSMTTVHFSLKQRFASPTPGEYNLACARHHIGLVPHSDRCLELPCAFVLAEISRLSETSYMFHNPPFDLVLAICLGFTLSGGFNEIKVYFPTHKLMPFERNKDKMVHSSQHE